MVRRIVIAVLRAYRYVLSPLLGPRCRFVPSCSEYAIGSLQAHGVVRGAWLSTRRLCKCHPWHPGGYDPVIDPVSVAAGAPVAEPAVDRVLATDPGPATEAAAQRASPVVDQFWHRSHSAGQARSATVLPGHDSAP